MLAVHNLRNVLLFLCMYPSGFYTCFNINYGGLDCSATFVFCAWRIVVKSY